MTYILKGFWFIVAVFILLFTFLSKNQLTKYYSYDLVFLALASFLMALPNYEFIKHYRLLILVILFVIFRILNIILITNKIPSKQARNTAIVNEIFASLGFMIFLLILLLYIYIDSLKYKLFFLLQIGVSLYIFSVFFEAFSYSLIC